jgi:NAD(P)-dependent dehydrogenase (short-subunit alcohol dehydrogenase family)
MAEIEVFFGDYAPDMLLADIHVHTTHSDGWWEPERLAEAAVTRGLSAIAVTDHDEISGAHAVANAAAQGNLPLQVLIGQEVSARVDDHDIHILGLDLSDVIRPWQSIEATVEAILAQGGFPILPHPKAEGFGRPTFEQVLAIGHPVAVEIYNASVDDLLPIARLKHKPDANAAARQFYVEHREQLAGAVGGTDAHFRTVGRGLTGYRGDLRTAIESSQTAVLFRRERERLLPWDGIGYWRGLKRLDKRRSERFGPRPR